MRERFIMPQLDVAICGRFGAELIQQEKTVAKFGVTQRVSAMLPLSAKNCAADNNGQTDAKDRLSEADQSGRQTWQTGRKSLRWRHLWRLSHSVQAKGRHDTIELASLLLKGRSKTNFAEVL
jgi:hypothetical protein